MTNSSSSSSLTKDEMKKFGIFFTPDVLVNKLISFMEGGMEFKTILEPSCGDGQFLKKLIKTYPSSKITAYELNENVFNMITDDVKSKITLFNDDFLKSSVDEKYDYIIGNPPFYVLSKDDEHKGMYKEYYTGRINIFILFIIHSLKKLNPGGVLSFIIPEAFLNCKYYELTRLYIKNDFRIIAIEKNENLFKDTKYSTISITIENDKPDNGENDKWFYNEVMVYDNKLFDLINKKR